MQTNIGAIILAAGKGKRMQSKDINKVVFPLGGKPMILHTVEFIKNFGIQTIVVVVGFAKESVMQVLGNTVIYAEQKEQLGTAHAVSCGLEKFPDTVKNILIVNGDDSAFYKHGTIKQLIQKHLDSNAAATFLTTEKEMPVGIGRVVRDQNHAVIKIIEEKDATEEEKQIKEINVGCYLFQADFLKTYLKLLEKSNATGEYYLTGLIDLAIKNNEKIETVTDKNLFWQGINTPEELKEAERLFTNNI